MRWCVIPLLLLQVGLICSAQPRLDSIKLVAESDSSDSIRVAAYLKLYYEHHRTDVGKAYTYAQHAERLSQEAGLESSLATSKFRKATALITMDSLGVAQTSLQEAYAIFDRLGDKQGLSFVKVEQAKIQQRLSNVEAAIRIYLEVLPLTQETGNKNTEARVLNYLGSLYKLQKQNQKAIEYYQLALDLVVELDFKPGISACLMNLSTMYRIEGNYDQSVSLLERSIELKREMGDRLGLGRGLDNLAKLHATRQDYVLASKYYKEALDVATELKNPTLTKIATFGLAENEYNLGNYASSIMLANEVLAKASSSKDMDLQVQAYAVLTDAYEKTGQLAKAYESAKLYNSLSDSLYNEQIVAITNDLEAKYQSEQKAREIALLESENRVQELQIQSRSRERNYLLGFAVIVLIVSALIYNQYRIKQKANAKLRELDHLKSDFFANISHEFRTPLSLIMSPLKARISDSTDTEEIAQFDTMYRNAERLLHLIDQLLDLSKLEDGKIKLEKSSIEITHFFKIIAASFSSLADYQGINFKSEFPSSKVWLEFDQDIIQKVCYNLLSNAFKFTPEGGEVNLRVSMASGNLKIIVTDSGSGIPADEHEKVFDRFFQSSASQQAGTGIGLALTKELVEFHGGVISLESTVGLGTLISIEIPVEESDSDGTEVVAPISVPEPIRNAKPEAIEDETFEAGPLILVIEDNEDLREYLGQVLKSKYAVRKSRDGIEGVRMAKEIMPDLIVSDVMMPGIDGIEVCRQLKEASETDHIPIILLTARADQESKFSGLTGGADAYLLKPFDPEELKIRVVNLLDQRNKLKEKYAKLLLLEPGEIEIESAEESFVKKAVEIVESYISDSEYTVDQFALDMGMSRMQLHRKLTALTGHSATAFVRHQRLTRAAQLLEAGNTASQVAYAVGFNSPSYFTKTFKEEFGRSPSEYGQKVN